MGRTSALFLFAVLLGFSPFHPAKACNLAQNPSFEEGEQDWTWKSLGPYWHGFTVSSEHAHRGDRSALLSLQNGPVGPQAQIWGAVQEFPISKLPQKLGVWYRVDNWKQLVTRQYIQIVFIIHDPRLTKVLGQPHMQLRYILAGLSEAPHPNPMNGRFLVTGSLKPKQGRWIHFETDPVADFIKAWGWYPENFEKLEVFLETRYDDPLPANRKVSAKVYWDDFELCP